ncbi:MAG: Integral rane protein TerC family protein [Novosphingobium sp.]|nr:Integral rane protein TerC family protein [Novosphingobium sp.]
MLQFYKGSILFSAACLAAAAWYGWAMTGTLAGTLSLLWIVVVLSILEVSLSFDNAVVNAKVLQEMDAVWQKRFLTWGMIIAVFGMRVIFPLAIVAIAAGLGPIDTIKLSLNDPERYEAIVSSAHVGIAGFGGAFLAMVGLKYFFDSDKEVHWIGMIERRLSSFARVEALEIALLLIALYLIAQLLPDADALTFMVAGTLGIVTFIGVEAISTILELQEEARAATGAVVRSGLGGFLYLNVLDGSFSFDGVIGAFALSNNMVVIALGLSIGAMFVRSMTIMLVQKGTLAQYRYLEHGAFWAIVALGGIMLLSARFHIPEAITGLIGAVLIGISLWWSIRWRKLHPGAE